MTEVPVNRKKPNWGMPNVGPHSHVRDLAEEEQIDQEDIFDLEEDEPQEGV